MQKSILLAAIQKEIQRHDLSYFVDEPPSVAQGGPWCCCRWLSGVQKADQYDGSIHGPSDQRCDASVDRIGWRRTTNRSQMIGSRPLERSDRILAMLVSYVDDSGSHDTSPSYVLSAFYTTPKHWEKILREWLGMVHRYGVTAFHATDCANGAKEFAGWSQLRKKKMFRNLINILTRHSDLRGCSACVVLKDYDEVVYPEAHELFGGPKVLTFQLLALEVASRANQPVAFIMDKPSKGWGALDDIFDKTKKLAEKRPWADNLYSLTPGNIRTSPAIQTADLLAYESYRELKEKTKTEPRRRLRKSMRRLMVEKSLTAPYLEKKSLLSVIEQCKKDGKLKP